MKDQTSQSKAPVEQILQRYGDMLYRLCVILLKNESDAQDAVQETIIRYYQKAPQFESREHEKAWLIRVATNISRDLLRCRARHPQLEEDLQTYAVSQEPSDSGILEALAAVPEKYRLVLTLYYIEEYRIEDIARIINRTTSAVKMRLQKGRRLLEEIYRKEYL